MAQEAQPITVELIRIDPRELKLLEVNARFMPFEQYQRLVENVRRDGALTQIPFAALDGEGRWEVLSGNNRVKAAIDAELDEIDCLVTRDTLPHDRRVAIQLSHNAIVGQDDPAVLAQLYASIASVEERLYSGLDDDVVGVLEEASAAPLSEFGLDYRSMTFLFLPHELERIERTFAIAHEAIPAERLELMDVRDFERFCEAMERVQADHKIANRAATLKIILDVFEQHYAPPESEA